MGTVIACYFFVEFPLFWALGASPARANGQTSGGVTLSNSLRAISPKIQKWTGDLVDLVNAPRHVPSDRGNRRRLMT